MTKLAYNRHLEKYAISSLGAILDTDTDLNALMARHEMLDTDSTTLDTDSTTLDTDSTTLDTDSDVLDTLDFDIEGLELKEISSEEILESYIQKQISRIPQHGDDCLWRIASACDLFEDLSIDGSLTPYQKDRLEAFVEQIKFSNESLDHLQPLE
jgi:hypothetical protein